MLFWSRCEKERPSGPDSYPLILGKSAAMQVSVSPAVSASACAAMSLLTLTLLLLLCLIKKKRRMEGTYRPSSEERKQTATKGWEKPGLPLPLPKEERLI
ncbi:unnamed protein product [Ophioblennius macclurei]